MFTKSKKAAIRWDDGASELDLAGERIVSEITTTQPNLQRLSRYQLNAELLVVTSIYEVAHG